MERVSDGEEERGNEKEKGKKKGENKGGKKDGMVGERKRKVGSERVEREVSGRNEEERGSK